MVWIKIRVMAVVAITRPPTGVDCELRQVSEPMPDQGGVNSGGSAAHQGAKRIEICRSRSLGDQIRVQELVMSDLIISVVVDVLIHVFVQHRESGSVELDCQCRLALQGLGCRQVRCIGSKNRPRVVPAPLGTGAVPRLPM